MQKTTLKINEIFYSIQGESLFVGRPTVFVRLALCNLRCHWCDTTHAYWEGNLLNFDEILGEVKKHRTKYVCITGGEPLAQGGTIALMRTLLKEGYVVSLETNGSYSIKDVPFEVVKVVDIKCPESGEKEMMVWENLELVCKRDQFKFVVASKKDFDWALEIIDKYHLSEKCEVLFSPVYGKVIPAELAKWILDSSPQVTLQVPLHKEIWGPDEKGV